MAAPGLVLDETSKAKGKGAGMNLNSILIGSENPQRLKDYYTKLFGKPTWDDGGYFGWQLGSGAVTVGPHDQVKGQNREPGRIIWNIETPDVQGEFKKLKAAGATVVKEPYDPAEGSEGSGMLISTFSDPDNNYFQLTSPMDAAAYEAAERMGAAKR
jgi:predicted enzyme related to lactoylglutathione lyase